MKRERAENRMMIIWKKSEISQRNNQRAQNISNLKIFYNLVLRFSSIVIGQSFSLIFCFFRSIKYFYAYYFKFNVKFELKKMKSKCRLT